MRIESQAPLNMWGKGVVECRPLKTAKGRQRALATAGVVGGGK